jgi:hypothetical protein
MYRLVEAASTGDIVRVEDLLANGADIREYTHGFTALTIAAFSGNHALALFLFVEGGACIYSITPYGKTVWDMLHSGIHARRQAGIRELDADGLSALLKVMVMLSDTPQAIISLLAPPQAELCTWGRQLRAQLPSYLEQQRAFVIFHSPLPDVLRSLVAEYAATTAEDMWKDGLHARAPRAKRPRAALAADDDGKEENERPLRRTLTLHKSRG